MDYLQVDSIIKSHHFDLNHAFTDVTVLIRPIPDMDGCPLGLYFHSPGQIGLSKVGPGSIVIPPDSFEAVLLHELGHRHGDYYFHNLSEPYAEAFRKKYQASRAPVLFYDGYDLRRMPKFGRLFQEGERGAIELGLDRPLTAAQAYGLRGCLVGASRGEPIPRIVSSSTYAFVRLEFTHGVDWFLIIAGALAFAGIAALSYAVYKIAKESPWVFPVALVGTIAGGLLLGRYVGRRLTRVPVRT